MSIYVAESIATDCRMSRPRRPSSTTYKTVEEGAEGAWNGGGDTKTQTTPGSKVGVNSCSLAHWTRTAAEQAGKLTTTNIPNVHSYTATQVSLKTYWCEPTGKELTSRRSMKGSVSSSQAMLVLFFSPPESPLLSGPPMTVSKSKRGGEENRRTIMTHCT